MLEVGQKGPEFSLPGVDGHTYTLSHLIKSHRAVAVVFSCNHCPYVRAWEGRMKEIQRDYRERGVVLAAINPNDAVKYPEDDFEHMQQRARQEGFNFLYLRDESQAVARAYGATHTPHVFLLDGQDILRYRGAIDDNYEELSAVKKPYLRDALDAVLAGQPPAIPVSDARGCTVKWK